MEIINLLLKNTLNSHVVDNEYPELYIDYLNVACLLASVRNGIHLDNIQNDELIYNLTEEEFERIFNCLDTIFSKHS